MTSNPAGNAESPDCCLHSIWQDNRGLPACRAHLAWEDKAGMLLGQPVGYPASTWGSRKAGSPTHSTAALVCQPVAKEIREKSWKYGSEVMGKDEFVIGMQHRGCVRGVCDSYMLGHTVHPLLSIGNSAGCLPTKLAFPVFHQGSTAMCSTAHGLRKKPWMPISVNKLPGISRQSLACWTLPRIYSKSKSLVLEFRKAAYSC